MSEHAVDESPLFCDRCTAQLHPGSGDFFEVHIQAFADPTPPSIQAEELEGIRRRDWQKLCKDLSNYSERELMDQVYRKVQIYLCHKCFAGWIENPAGDAAR